MTTTALVIIALVVIVLAVVVALTVRARRRGAQASERMGLPPLGAVSGEPLDTAPATESENPTGATKPPTKA